MSKWFGNIIDRLFVFVFALLFMQLPMFMLQYQHELRGHVNELNWQVNSMHKAASQSEKSLDEYILKFESSLDFDFSSQGKMMKKIHTRFEKFSNALFQLENSTPFSQPWHFIKALEKDIFYSTLHSFEPGIPLSSAGLLYALLGLAVGSFISLVFKKLLSKSINFIIN